VNAAYTRPALADWFYVPSWKRIIGAGDAGTTLPTDGAAWLILADETGVGARMADRIVAAGQPCFTVRPGAAYSVSGDQYTVRPTEREDYDQTIADILARGVEIRRIVHAWSITAPERDVELDAAMERGFFSVVSLMQALGDLHVASDPLAITVISNGLQQVLGHELLSPAKALVLGPCRVIPEEFPAVSCRSVDIDLAGVNEHLIDELVLGAAGGTQSGCFAYRAGNRWAETVERISLPEHDGPPPRLRDHGVYLVTGGLGGLGLQVAKFLASTVRARLVLTGRSEFPPREQWADWIASHKDTDPTSQSISAIQDLEVTGAEVLVMRAHVEERDDMERVAAAAHDRFGAVNGVFHVAGVANSAMVQLMERDRALTALAPKVAGTLVLGSVFPESELDLLVLFSSINSLSADAGSASYSAANIYLDKYAIAHRSASRAILSINWDAWQDVGMAAARAAASTRANVPRLAYAIRPEEGIEALQRALGTSVPEVAVIARWDLRELIEFSQKPKRIADHHTGDGPPVGESALSQHARPDLEQGFVAPRNDQERFIASVWEELLGLDRVGIDDNFFELGGHSLIATGLLARIHKELQVKLPLRTIFEASTVRGLAERVSEVSWVSQPSNVPDGEEGREEFEI
jgi:NADP-dependent 3-hydroxy acid dehydrogenase YdfG/acyl carrier protein